MCERMCVCMNECVCTHVNLQCTESLFKVDNNKIDLSYKHLPIPINIALLKCV